MVEAAAAGREERKVVSVLFADIVGFTSRAEQLDPEDVRALLAPYFARLRTELERFGGSVEKFIGDAVVAVFGAPVAHEDDPERAVRAALAIRDWVLAEQSDLQLRIAVNTGEALVALGGRQNLGEGIATGDVMNTASRLQAAAPVNGVLVGDATYRSTNRVIVYRDAPAISAKGKSVPVRVWEAIGPRSRPGSEVASTTGAPLIGRVAELDALKQALEHVRRDRVPQLMTIAGVPGIGKSRLVAELFRDIDEDPNEIVLWRQGRSLPYGDGVTFWALGEMVKAQAGILETDSPEQAEQKLHDSVRAVIPESDGAQWIEGHLRPLAGLGTATATGSERAEEAFTAWRHFLEALAGRNPLVLAFEDLHWADDNLLDFIEYLVDSTGGVPILVVCTARPELFERRVRWDGSAPNAATLSLSPLSDDETARLIESLTRGLDIPAETQRELLGRASGNPLYAEQYVRMVAERLEAEGLPLPETIQGIIAARLDALPVEEKRLLQDAAVIGKVFWLGAVTVGGAADSASAEPRLKALERKEFIRHARNSSVAGEAEYAFLHILIRDVAYSQIPRVERAEKHRRAAEWIRSLGRTGDHAEMLAHHYLKALELRRAARQPVDAPFADLVLASLRDAGERALSLNAHGTAARFFEAALELAPPDSPQRARLLFKLARTRHIAGYIEPDLLAAAFAELLACGDHDTAAEAEATLGELNWVRGDRDRAFEHLAHAHSLIQKSAPSRAKAYVISSYSRLLMLAGENPEAIRLGVEALGIAEQHDLNQLRAHALNTIGVSRVHSGDDAGIADLEQSIAIALEANAVEDTCRAQANLGSMFWEQGDLERAHELWMEAEKGASHFGHVAYARWFRGLDVEAQYTFGRWDQALSAADRFISEVEAGAPYYLAPRWYTIRALIHVARGNIPESRDDARRSLELARLAKDPQSLYATLAGCAHVFRESGDTEQAVAIAEEFLVELRSRGRLGSAREHVHTLAWMMTAAGHGQELIDALPAGDTPWSHAAVAFIAGDLERAADICRAMGAATDEARDRLWLAASLVAERRHADADVHLQRALTFYRSVRALRYIREGEALLTASV
jgi:class 3 adenylate cyclase/tetratricopeptide (TPR) repeat protein